MRRLLVLSLLVYLALDFGDPSMPGALNFDPDQSVVEALSTQPRGGALVHTIAALVPGRHGDDDPDRLLVTAGVVGRRGGRAQTGKTRGAQVIGTSGSAEKLASTTSRPASRPRSGTPDNEGFQAHHADTTWPIVVDCLQRTL